MDNLDKMRINLDCPDQSLKHQGQGRRYPRGRFTRWFNYSFIFNWSFINLIYRLRDKFSVLYLYIKNLNKWYCENFTKIKLISRTHVHTIKIIYKKKLTGQIVFKLFILKIFITNMHIPFSLSECILKRN